MISRTTPWTLAALLLGSVPQLVAAQADKAASCVEITNDAQRLACYDSALGRGTTSVAAPTPAGSHTAAVEPTRQSQPASAARKPATHLASRWDLDGEHGALFSPRPYRPVYILPATWTSHINHRPASPAVDHTVLDDLELRPVETKYQLSLKAKLGENLLGTPTSLWGGYTQSSRWQVYNGADSRPFRETNYEPEVMLSWPLAGQLLGWNMRVGTLSLTHQSNGRALPLSRSWNRVIGSVAMEKDEWVAEFRPWSRISEPRNSDDNPDMEDFIGRGELNIGRYWGDQALMLQLRHSLRGGERSHGSAQLDWVFPINGVLHGYFQVFTGYGESLIDYNLRQTKIGLGLTIAGWR